MGIRSCYYPVKISRINQINNDPESLLDIMDEIDEELEEAGLSAVDIDKSWDPLHYLLNIIAVNGKDMLQYAVLGKHEFDDEWKYLLEDEVKQIANLITKIDFEELWTHFSDDRDDIYIQLSVDNEEHKKYVQTYFEILQDFYKDAAQNNMSVIIAIN